MRLLDVVLYTVALPTPSTSSYTHADHVPVGRPGSLSETNLAVARGMMCRDTNGLSLLPPQLLQPLPSILRSDLLSLSLSLVCPLLVLCASFAFSLWWYLASQTFAAVLGVRLTRSSDFRLYSFAPFLTVN